MEAPTKQGAMLAIYGIEFSVFLMIDHYNGHFEYRNPHVLLLLT